MTHLPLLLALQDAAPAVVPADTAWMLVATALVLLMTPALAFFYGGLVRSKNSLNTMMMSFVALGVVGIVWALARPTAWRSRAGNAWLGGLSQRAAGRRRPRGQGHHPARAVHGLSGHVRHHHRRADLGRDRGADAVRAVPRVHRRCGRSLVYAPVAHWVWGGGWLATLGVLDFAGGTVVHINAGVSALVAALVLGQPQGLRPPGHPAAQRALRAARRRAALVRLVRLQRRQRARGERLGGAGVHQHLPRADGDAGGLDAARLLSRTGTRHRRRRRHRHRGRARGHHAGRRLRQPDRRAAARRARRVPELLRHRAGASRTRLDDSLDVFAGHGIGGITGALLTGVFAAKAWRRHRRPARRQPRRSSAIQALGVARVDRLRGAGDLRASSSCSALVIALRAAPARRRARHGRHAARRGSLQPTARARSSCCPMPAPWVRRLAR